MYFARPTLADLALAGSYFLTAALAIALTRFDGGVAFLWISSSLLIPFLARRRRRDWGTPMLLCGAASALATGWFGLGWALALPFAVINMVEAWIGAKLLTRRRSVQRSLGSLGWIGSFVVAVGIAAPLAAGLAAGAVVSATGRPFLPAAINFWAGHALGNITFIPVVALLIGGELRRLIRQFTGPRFWELAALLALVAATTFVSFSDTKLPLMFLPCGPIVLAIFRGRQIGAAVSIVLLALIGGGMTIAGHGPVQLIDAPMGTRLQFLQFYLAAVVLTALPIAADLRNRARLYRELRYSEERYRMLADHSSDILMHGDLEGRVRFVSPAIRQLGGYEPEELVGHFPSRLIAPEDWPLIRAEHGAAIGCPGETRTFEYRGIMRDGRERWFETRCRAIVDRDGQVDGLLSIIRDISARKETEAALTAAAMTDPLTGLPNRRAFRAAAERLLATDGAARRGCIAIIDLDHFKKVNDLHGHDGGDAVLCQFAEQAREAVREGDMVARLGGEEFALLLPGASIEHAIAISDRLRLAIAAMGVPGKAGMIRVTMSGGVAELEGGGLEVAMKRADLALYQAKAGGRDQLALAA